MQTLASMYTPSMKFCLSILLCVVLCSGIANVSHAQKGRITGLVTDESSGAPLIGAAVQVNDQGDITDINGKYIMDLEPGDYSIHVSYLGFRKQSIFVTILSGETVTLDVKMVSANILLEEAIISGAKYEHRVAESTISVDIIKSNLIESINAITPDEALDKISGVQIIDDQANIRGGSGWSYGAGSRVMLLIDDMPALQADAGLPQWSDIPTENISQIEVVKGAASALYGSSALNGIINVRTDYATSEPQTKLSIFHTQYLSPKDPNKKWWTKNPMHTGYSLMHKQKFGKLDVVAGAFYFNQDSTRVYNEETFRRKARVNLNLRYRVTDRMTLGLNSFFNDGNSSSFFLWSNGTTGAYRALPGTVTKSNNLRYIIDPSFTYFDRKNNKHKIQSRYYHINNDNNMDQSNASDLYYLEYQFQRKFSGDLSMTAGAQGTWVRSDSELFSDTIITSRNYAMYLQTDKKFFEKLNLAFGLRYEYNRHNTPRNFMGILIPGGKLDEGKLISRFGMNYELSEGTFLRASWGQGFRYPTITERFIRTAFSGFTIFPNADLFSETGWSSEIGIKQGFRLLNFQGFLDIATFLSEYNNMMEFTFHTEDNLTGFQSQNVGDTRIKGIEISLLGQSSLFGIPLRLYGGYTYIDPIYQDFTDQLEIASSVDYNVLKYRTKHHLNFDVEGEWKNIVFGLSLTGASHMLAIDQALESFATIKPYRDFNSNGYRKFDVRLAYSYHQMKLSILFNNLLNEEYTERPALLEAPRNIGIRFDMHM